MLGARESAVGDARSVVDHFEIIDLIGPTDVGGPGVVDVEQSTLAGWVVVGVDAVDDYAVAG